MLELDCKSLEKPGGPKLTSFATTSSRSRICLSMILSFGPAMRYLGFSPGGRAANALLLSTGLKSEAPEVSPRGPIEKRTLVPYVRPPTFWRLSGHREVRYQTTVCILT